MTKAITAKAKKIKLLILDVDGIMTDGSINIDDQGVELKKFNVHDGFAIVLFRKTGHKVALISARAAKAVEVRAKDLKIDRVYQAAHPKTAAYNELKKEFQLKDDEICFMGDDLPDLGVLKAAGLAVTVPNAAPEAKKLADYTTKHPGGHGAVREVVEIILKAQGHWKNIVKEFSS